jgi:hypothetical protein
MVRAEYTTAAVPRRAATGERFDGGGGGAIFDRGGRLRIVNSTFRGNRCEHVGPAAESVGATELPCVPQRLNPPRPSATRSARPVPTAEPRNGGALSSIGVSWTVLNSRFTANRAIGIGANPARCTMAIRNSTLTGNPNARFHTPGLPGIYFLGARRPTIRDSVLRPAREVPIRENQQR